MKQLHDQALALAGVAQFALYAHALAQDGVRNPARIKRALQAICCTDPKTSEEVFGGVSGVTDGRRFLRIQFEGGSTERADALVSRSIGQVLKLSSRLRRDSRRLNNISAGIAQAAALDPAQAPRVLDDIYRQNISDLRPRIMIPGDQSVLGDAGNAACVRTYLLAAIRCAILWRQSGGSLWRLVLQRRSLAQALSALDRSDPVTRDD